MLKEKTINEVVNEFKQAFGELAFVAEQTSTGVRVASKDYKESPMPVLQITASDYLALAACNINNPPTPMAWGGVATIAIKGKR